MKKTLTFLLVVFSIAVFAVLFFVFLGGKNIPQKKPEAGIALPQSLSEQLGQSFIIGIEGKTLDENTKHILSEIKPAGVVLYYRNFENPTQFKNLISQLQVLALSTTGQKYFIMIDEEPGGATRLDLFDNVFAFGTPNWGIIEKGIKTMEDVGINVDLAPIADFPFNNNSFIKDRVPAHSIANLEDFNKKFITMLGKNHVMATLKHFPGMGVFVQDPHKILPYADPVKAVIDKSLGIFKSGVDAGADFVMTCHGVFDDIDPANPATLSKKITTDILRGQIGFKGIAITDDLSDMPFIVGKSMSLSQASAQSLKAGHNLLMFSHRPEETVKIFNELEKMAGNDVSLKFVIVQNYKNIVALKNKK